MNSGILGLAGEKLSKSVGNLLLADAMITQVRPAELRYYLGQAPYRSEIEYSRDALAEATAAYRRIEGFVTRAPEADPAVGSTLPAPSAAALPPRFSAAMDEDLGVPQALAVVHAALTEGHTALAARDVAGAAKQAADVRAMMSVLGLDPLAEQWSGSGGDEGLRPVVDSLVAVALRQRQAARERRDYAAADGIREALADAGIQVEDTPRGPRWELRR